MSKTHRSLTPLTLVPIEKTLSYIRACHGLLNCNLQVKCDHVYFFKLMKQLISLAFICLCLYNSFYTPPHRQWSKSDHCKTNIKSFNVFDLPNTDIPPI